MFLLFGEPVFDLLVVDNGCLTRKPAVIMIVGVHGAGKTISLGKLANRLKKEGAKVLLAAGDTFRAAASDQLEIWIEISKELQKFRVDELGIPVKFVGVGEGVEDLQPFDAEAFVNAKFP
ncbi:cell division homolog, chloroplastic [Olea europaea subsp. europaea]|uniref:Cell division homolog, chloroplastic n=1 Tax=Olea europaea subsp. europaea TaxID=158383 RepID=A0A8S0VD43_OLEEU|nr:cell division homolog, chloroplastic [Olea europaea subsp. europaea]